jgi:hypothetical protein
VSIIQFKCILQVTFNSIKEQTDILILNRRHFTIIFINKVNLALNLMEKEKVLYYIFNMILLKKFELSGQQL